MTLAELASPERRSVGALDWQAGWPDDAPYPDEVNARVLSLVAGRVTLASERRLRCEDHADAMRMLVAADTYYDLLAHFFMYETPDSAEECFRVHKLFAQTAMSVRLDGGSGEAAAAEALAALAAECHLARGRMCPDCRLPLVLHIFDQPGLIPCPPKS